MLHNTTITNTMLSNQIVYFRQHRPEKKE